MKSETPPTVSLRDALENIIHNSYVGKGDKPVTRSKYANYPARLYHAAKVALAASPTHTPAPETSNRALCNGCGEYADQCECGIGSTPHPAVEVTEKRALSDYDYNELWDAIAKATRIDGGIIAISVRTFRSALAASASTTEDGV